MKKTILILILSLITVMGTDAATRKPGEHHGRSNASQVIRRISGEPQGPMLYGTPGSSTIPGVSMSQASQIEKLRKKYVKKLGSKRLTPKKEHKLIAEYKMEMRKILSPSQYRYFDSTFSPSMLMPDAGSLGPIQQGPAPTLMTGRPGK